MNLDKLQQWLQENDTDVAYISSPTTINYFTGFITDPEERIFKLFAFKDADPFIFCPALNYEEAKASAWDGDVVGYLDDEDPWKKIAAEIKKRTKDFQSWAVEKDGPLPSPAR